MKVLLFDQSALKRINGNETLKEQHTEEEAPHTLCALKMLMSFPADQSHLERVVGDWFMRWRVADKQQLVL